MNSNLSYAFVAFWPDFDFKRFQDAFFPFLNPERRTNVLESTDLIVYSVFQPPVQRLQSIKQKKGNKVLILQWNWEPHILDQKMVFTDWVVGGFKTHPKHIYTPLSLYYLYLSKTDVVSPEKPIPSTQRKFCAFVCSNPRATFRMDVYKRLCLYKHVDGFGKAFGRQLQQGNWWSQDYLNFMGQYKFIFCFENTKRSGYNTEKIINPLLAKVIPLYWGSDDILEYVNPNAILFLRGESLDDIEHFVQEVQRVDQDDALYQQMLNEPPFLHLDIQDRPGGVFHTQRILSELMGPVHVYWINVDSQFERCMYTQKTLDFYQIPHTRVPAITPHDLPPIPNITTHLKRATRNELACLLSHLCAIEQGYKDNHDWFMVLEDDMCIFPETPFDFKELLAIAPSDAEILHLSMSSPYALPVLFQQYVGRNLHWVPWNQNFWSAGCYLVSRTGAEKILRTDIWDTPYRKASDIVLFHLAKTYTSTHPLVHQHLGFQSNIHVSHAAVHQRAMEETKQIFQKCSIKQWIRSAT